MTQKTGAWFERKRYTKEKRRANKLSLISSPIDVMQRLGEIIYTDARINGKWKRVRCWYP